MSDDRFCANPACRKPLVQRSDERNSDFRRRGSCNSACANAASRDTRANPPPAPPDRHCPCGSLLVQRDGEPMNRFRKRTTCGPTCHKVALDKGRAKRWEGHKPKSVSTARPRPKASQRRSPPAAAAVLPTTDDVAEFIRTRGITRCPTACVLPTTASVPEPDRAALAAHEAALEQKALRRLSSRWGWNGAAPGQRG